MNNEKLRKCIKRTAERFEPHGYRVGLAYSLLAETFDVIVDSTYNSDPGLYVKCCLQEVRKEELDAIRFYRTQRKKELWIWRFKKDVPNDKGRPFKYRFEGSELIERPQNWPLSKVMSSANIGKKTTKKA